MWCGLFIACRMENKMKALLAKYDLDVWEGWAILAIRALIIVPAILIILRAEIYYDKKVIKSNWLVLPWEPK